MSQRQVADYLEILPSNVSNMIKARKIEPFYVFDDESVRNINLFIGKILKIMQISFCYYINIVNDNKVTKCINRERTMVLS